MFLTQAVGISSVPIGHSFFLILTVIEVPLNGRRNTHKHEA